MNLRGIGPALAVVALVGCDDRSVPTVPADPPLLANVAGADRARDVAPLRIELPPEPRDWDLDDAVLVEVVARAGGVMLVGLKAPSAVRVHETREVVQIRGTTRAFGERAGLSREAALHALAILEGRGAHVIYYANRSGIAVIQAAAELAPRLRALDVVDYLEPTSQLELATVGAVTATVLAGQTTPWGIQMIKAPLAWTLTKGNGARILMIDSGHRQNHEDLPAIPSVNCGGAYGGCNDDPLTGWHGTHVLGIFTARDNAVGYVGAAPSVAASNTYVWGACYHDYDTGWNPCDVDAVIAGLNEGIEWGVDVINMSFAGVTFPSFTALSNQVATAVAADIVLVAAAGNVTVDTVRYPAGFSGVLGVSGVTDSGVFATHEGPLPAICGGDGSGYGSHVDLAAPYWAWSTVGPANNDYAEACGTSMAAPHVAGVAGLMRARFPNMSADSIRNRLRTTAYHPNGQLDNTYGYGIVDADRALGVLHADIDGPKHLTVAGWHEWEVEARGGEFPYTYQWQVRWDDFGQTWYNLGTGAKQQLNVDESDGNFTLQVSVTSGDQSRTPVYPVVNGIGCDPEFFC